jgi:hypothetical protein
VNIFGCLLPWTKAARRQSGVGVAGYIGGEWSPLLADNVKARIGLNLYRVDYSGGAFDDMIISTYGGPQFLFANWDFSVLATGFKRWYANKDYLSGVGGKLAADYGITSDWLVGASVGGQSIANDFVRAQDGPLWSAQTQVTYVLTPSSLFQLQLGYNRQEAQIAPYSYSAVWFGGGYQQDFPFGFSAAFQPNYSITSYDAALAALGKPAETMRCHYPSLCSTGVSTITASRLVFPMSSPNRTATFRSTASPPSVQIGVTSLF